MNNKSSGGIGCSTVVLIIFVILKLVGVINWSWWWVLSPLWIDIAILLIAILILVAFEVHDNKKYGFTLTKDKKNKWKF